MRVTFLHPTHALVPSGGGRVVHEYANYLVRRGHEVNLIFPFRVRLGLGIERYGARRICDWLEARTSATIRLLMGKSALRLMALDPRINLCFVAGLDPGFIPD